MLQRRKGTRCRSLQSVPACFASCRVLVTADGLTTAHTMRPEAKGTDQTIRTTWKRGPPLELRPLARSARGRRSRPEHAATENRSCANVSESNSKRRLLVSTGGIGAACLEEASLLDVI